MTIVTCLLNQQTGPDLASVLVHGRAGASKAILQQKIIPATRPNDIRLRDIIDSKGPTSRYVLADPCSQSKFRSHSGLALLADESIHA